MKPDPSFPIISGLQVNELSPCDATKAWLELGDGWYALVVAENSKWIEMKERHYNQAES
jgi:hypothetical protein